MSSHFFSLFFSFLKGFMFGGHLASSKNCPPSSSIVLFWINRLSLIPSGAQTQHRHKCTCAHRHTHTDMHTYTHTHIHTHIHTHTHAGIRLLLLPIFCVVGGWAGIIGHQSSAVRFGRGGSTGLRVAGAGSGWEHTWPEDRLQGGEEGPAKVRTFWAAHQLQGARRSRNIASVGFVVLSVQTTPLSLLSNFGKEV